MATRNFKITDNVTMNEKIYYNIEDINSPTEYIYKFSDGYGNFLSLTYHNDNKYPFNVLSHSSVDNNYEVKTKSIHSVDNDIKNVSIVTVNKNSGNKVSVSDAWYNEAMETRDWMRKVLESANVKVKVWLV